MKVNYRRKTKNVSKAHRKSPVASGFKGVSHSSSRATQKKAMETGDHDSLRSHELPRHTGENRWDWD